MIVPDYIEPFVGWRSWSVTDDGDLQSPSFSEFRWPKNKPSEALCNCDSETGCKSCGFYSCKTWTLLRERGYPSRKMLVVGEVYLWGRVVEHHDGYRSTFAYPKNLNIILNNEPVQIEKVEQRVRGLVEYKVDVGILKYLNKDAKHDVFTPLINKHSQWQQPGIDVLLDWTTSWYKPPTKELYTPKLENGSKILAKGYIWVVFRIDNGYVHMRRGCGDAFSMPVTDLIWDRTSSMFVRKNTKLSEFSW